jgi:hypothetical protein
MQRHARRRSPARFIGYAAAALGSAALAAGADLGTRVAYSGGGAVSTGLVQATDRLRPPIEYARPVRVVLASPYGN